MENNISRVKPRTFVTKFGMSFVLPGTEDDFVTGQLDPLASDGHVTEGSGLQQEIEIRWKFLGTNLATGLGLHLNTQNEISGPRFPGGCSTHPRGGLAGLLHILPVDGDLAQDRQLVLGGDLVVLGVKPQQTGETEFKFYVSHEYLAYLCGINLAASKPNIGLPICVSDSLMDFFFRKTFSPLADTTLNSILPEKVAVNDLERKFIQTHKRKAISRQMWCRGVDSFYISFAN